MDLFDLFAKITLDSDEYTKGVEDAGKKSESLKSKVDGLASKIKSAQTSFDGFSDKAKESNSTMDSAAEKTSAASEETQKLATELKKAESNYKATSEELKNTKDELNNYGEKADEATNKTSKLGNALKNGLATAAKIGAAAIGAAATGIGALVKSSVDAYANYEQLVGGVETLFKTSSDKVMEYAANAYETAGMSANEYMETVTSFSASLLQSLDGDTAAAAEKANLAITDMSDNANKMGTSMEMIQNAYNGFAKQNYTMLDNLKLGYGGTKEEMQRLLDDAEKLSGQKFDLSSYGDIVEAIHVVQTEMGITGTTAKEASTTISGSFGAAKAAWENLVTGIANKDADLDGLIDNLVKKVTVAAGNVMPVAEKALDGVSQLIEGVLPIVAEALPNVISEVLPDLMNAAISFVSALGAGISENLEPLMNSAFEIVNSLMNFIVENAPKLIDASFDIIEKLGDGLAENAPNLISSATDVILTLAEKLTNPENLKKVLAAGLKIITSVGTSLIENVGKVTEKVPEIIQNLVDFLTNPDSIEDITNAGLSLVTSLLDNMDGIINGLMDGCFAIIDGIIGFIVGTEDNPESGLYKIIEAGFKLASELFKKMPAILLNLGTKIKELTDGIKKKILDVDWKKVGEDLINKIWEGLKNTWESLKEGFGDVWEKLFGDGDADVNINANVNGSHAGGLNYVPFDGYLAELHRGERVLTATEANQYSKGGGQSTVINQYNTFGGTNSLADQEKANQRLAAALSR